MPQDKQTLQRESLLLRLLWMVLFAIAWQFAELLLGLVVLHGSRCKRQA